MRMMASRGFRIPGSATRSTSTLFFPCQQSAFTKSSCHRERRPVLRDLDSLAAAQFRSAWTQRSPVGFRSALVAGQTGLLDCVFAGAFAIDHAHGSALQTSSAYRLPDCGGNFSRLKELFDMP